MQFILSILSSFLHLLKKKTLQYCLFKKIECSPACAAKIVINLKGSTVMTNNIVKCSVANY